MKAYMLLCEGFEESEAIITADILSRGKVDVEFVSPYGTDTVVGSHGFVISVNRKFSDIDKYDTAFGDADAVVLPGGKKGTQNLGESGAVLGMVKDYFEKGKTVAAVCAAPTVLGKAGILKGLKATCYPGFEGGLIGAKSMETPSCTDKNVVTGKSMGCSIDFALALLKELAGAKAAADVEEGICRK